METHVKLRFYGPRTKLGSKASQKERIHHQGTKDTKKNKGDLDPGEPDDFDFLDILVPLVPWW
jgi:hypothetical protein